MKYCWVTYFFLYFKNVPLFMITPLYRVSFPGSCLNIHDLKRTSRLDAFTLVWTCKRLWLNVSHLNVLNSTLLVFKISGIYVDSLWHGFFWESLQKQMCSLIIYHPSNSWWIQKYSIYQRMMKTDHLNELTGFHHLLTNRDLCWKIHVSSG